MGDRPLDGRVAIVTGAGRGIGRSVAVTLAQAGAAVALAARTEGQLWAVEREIASSGGRAISVPTDVSQEADAIALVQTTVERLGRLDILVNNAGISVFGPLAETSTEDWDRIMAVNARGPFMLCRESLPHLREQEGSVIVNVTSVVGVKGYANQAAYSASKHALMGMTKSLAREVQAEGIRVHAVCPGGVDTELIRRARPDLDRTVLMQPQEIADWVLFLVTRRGRAVADEIHLRRDASTPWA